MEIPPQAYCKIVSPHMEELEHTKEKSLLNIFVEKTMFELSFRKRLVYFYTNFITIPHYRPIS